MVRADFERAGFVLEAQSDLLRVPADDHSKNVFDPSIRGKTDRFVYRFRKPALANSSRHPGGRDLKDREAGSQVPFAIDQPSSALFDERHLQPATFVACYRCSSKDARFAMIASLPRREREIFEILCSAGEATAADVRRAMADPPSHSAVQDDARPARGEGAGPAPRRRPDLCLQERAAAGQGPRDGAQADGQDLLRRVGGERRDGPARTFPDR